MVMPRYFFVYILKSFEYYNIDNIIREQNIMAFPVTTYTVKKGDSLYRIADKYNTTVESIMQVNNLTGSALSVGQKLVIPKYTEAVVKAGGSAVYKYKDTKGDILFRFNEGTRLNVTNISGSWYKVKIFNGKSGWILSKNANLIAHDGSKPITYILGFYTLEEGPALPSSYSSFTTNINLLSSTGLFMFRIDRDNPTQIEKFGTFTDSDVKALVAIGHRGNVKMIPVIHNLLYEKGGTDVSKNVVKQTVATQASRRQFAQSVLRLVETYGFDGANLDIEDAYVEDSRNISLLYETVGDTLRKNGYYLSSSVPSRASDANVNPFSNPYNYAAIGRAVDEFGVMLYNEHGWPGSGPGPVVSIGWMERVLRYAITKMPREKIIADVSVFGFDFNTTANTIKYVTYDIAIATAQKYGKEVIFDRKTQTPMFAYVDENGNNHEVWFEDSRSIKAKVDLAYSLGVKGIALWRMGLEDKNIWNMLKNEAVVKK